ncbi:cell division protein [Thiocapsa imhoffii]|uniref:Peptidoglycan D,D-transpeptidase FtsI n=1 Tax=Thiocapsa imhoffii TaxID=382777 RepID=A0A9X0WEU5_9GAMM|nr:cell division protein [Thiocapsa imhoffii]
MRPAPRRAQPDLRLRRRILVGLLSAAFVVLSGAVFHRQVLETSQLQMEGERRHLRLAEIAARRGMITDRNGEPLAVSTPVETVTADPRKLIHQPAVIQPLAVALALDPKGLEQRIGETAGRGFIYLKRRVSFEEAAEVRRIVADYSVEGVNFETEYRRFYPGVEVFGHVLGFTNIDDRGQEGLELAYDSWLKSEPGLRRVIRDGRQQMIQEVEQVSSPRQGADLVLSLDRRLQFLAYRELKAAVSEHKAVGGTLVVLDVQTGEILAMVNQPGYNPNAQRDGGIERRRNRAVTDTMEPGSTIKPFVVAAAMERGLIGPTTPIATRGGTMRVGSNTVRDVRNYGNLTVTGVITKSSNVGVVRIAQMMGYDALWELYDQLGFGQRTAMHIPGESRGVLRHHSTWRVIEHATHAFGYGLSVTALQLAQAYSVLAADGIKRPVTLLRQDPAAARAGAAETRVLSEATAKRVRAMMETVVSPDGTAERAMIPGYRVAGKTGTAKKSSGRSGYGGGRYQAVFAGFAPAGEPRLVMVVMIDEPRGKAYYGGQVAAPVFQKVMEGALRLFNLPPDDPQPSMLLAHREDKP